MAKQAEKRRTRVLSVLAKIGSGTAGDVAAKLPPSARGDVRGIAQTLRSAVNAGLVSVSGLPGRYVYKLTGAGQRALA